MVVLIFAMLLTLGLALAVVGYVAVAARRDGRDLLTPHGERVMTRVRERSELVRERTGAAVDVARQRTGTTAAGARGRGSREAADRDDSTLRTG